MTVFFLRAGPDARALGSEDPEVSWYFYSAWARESDGEELLLDSDPLPLSSALGYDEGVWENPEDICTVGRYLAFSERILNFIPEIRSGGQFRQAVVDGSDHYWILVPRNIKECLYRERSVISMGMLLDPIWDETLLEPLECFLVPEDKRRILVTEQLAKKIEKTITAEGLLGVRIIEGGPHVVL